MGLSRRPLGRSSWLGALLGGALALGGVAAWPTPAAEAHLATWGSWDVTKKNLDVLFPEATQYMRKKHSFSASEVLEIERALGFSLYPEDRNPEFYIAVREVAGKQELLGVAIFIDPRSKPRVEKGEVVRLEVGIGVDGAGKVQRVALYDYRGDASVGGQGWLGQLQGRTLQSSFKLGSASADGLPALRPVPGEEEDCQLVANASFEALYLMKVALGRR